MNFRPATVDDLPRIKGLTGAEFDFARYLELPNYRTLVAEENGSLLGFAVVFLWRWNRTGQISELFVDPRLRGRGYGARLLAELLRIGGEEKLRLLFDHVSPQEPGLQFYLKSGFRISGYNGQFFDRPNHADRTALIVTRWLDSVGE